MATMALWRDAYGNGMQVMREVYIPTGDWLKENVPPDEAVAVFDIGAIVYRAERDVIDMGGITDPECADYLWGRQGHAYLRKKNAKWAVLPVLLSVNFWAPQAGYLGVPGAPRLTAEQRFVVSDIEAYVRWQLYQARAISPEAWICRLRFPPEGAGKASPR